MKGEENHSSYKGLLVWQKSMWFANDMIDLIDRFETDRKHYRLIEQLKAAVTSIPMNIAEGKGRDSKKEYIHFLHIARGFLFETLTLLEIFHMREWIKPDIFQNVEQKSTEIAKMFNTLINAISRTM